MRFAVITFPGTSGETDTVDAIQHELGEEAELVSHKNTQLEDYDAIVLAGGASYGDAVRPGAIAKMQPVMEAVKKAAENGKIILGVGNGFQILVEAGILPGALLQNESLKFVCKHVDLKVSNNDTIFTTYFEKEEKISIPIAHGKGNYDCDDTTLQQLKKNNQIVLTYMSENPNGSKENIAGIINEQGNVLGLMPHPERAVDKIFGSKDGLRLFQSIVRNWRNQNATN